MQPDGEIGRCPTQCYCLDTSPQVYLSYPHSPPATKVPGLRFQTPLAASITSKPAITGQAPQVHFSETTFHNALSPVHSESLPLPTAHDCAPNTATYSPSGVSDKAGSHRPWAQNVRCPPIFFFLRLLYLISLMAAGVCYSVLTVQF